VLSLPMPSPEVLNGGLEILKTADLRQPLTALDMPFCACTVAGWPGAAQNCPASGCAVAGKQSIVFDKAAHAPFISHPQAFCAPLIALKREIDKFFSGTW
jgi:pimeloyl-[acyl-carrier protein] methyl ester esterase